MKTEPEVLVVGGGPAGLAMTLALLSAGLKVILIERSCYDDVRVGEHLSPNAVPYLIRLGVLDLVKLGAHIRCPGIKSAWGSPNLADQPYIFNPYGDGFNLSRPAFDAALTLEAERRGATVLRGTRLKPPKKLPDGWRLTTDDGMQTFDARVLVDATGRAAWLARTQESEPIVYDKLVGLVGFLAPTITNVVGDYSLLIEACEDGWWYSAPLADGGLVAAYMTDSDMVSEAPDRPSAFWCERLKTSRYTKSRTTGFEITGEVHVRPAHSQTLSAVAGLNWISVGDAAMSFDPLSSAGISKGFEWGIRGARAIGGLLDGDEDTLNTYERDVQSAFKDYLQTRTEYYRMEQRWPNSLFWNRRHAN